MYRDQNSPGGVVERAIGVTDGSDCGPGDDATVAIDVGRRMVRTIYTSHVHKLWHIYIKFTEHRHQT